MRITRTVEELREEYAVLARLHQQHCTAFAQPDHPLIRKVARDMERVARELHKAKGGELT